MVLVMSEPKIHKEYTFKYLNELMQVLKHKFVDLRFLNKTPGGSYSQLTLKVPGKLTQGRYWTALVY